MAEKRMFTKSIIDSDNFLDLPATTQTLYFHLGMRADDEGFINNARSIARMVGATSDDIDLLVDNDFLIAFDSSVVVITHWRLNNNVQKDRLKETIYTEERAQLVVKENGAYALRSQSGAEIEQLANKLDTDCKQNDTECFQNVSKMEASANKMDANVTEMLPQNRIDKNRLDKSSVDKSSVGESSVERADKPAPTRTQFQKPTLDEVKEYVVDHGLLTEVNPARFFDYYESNGWKVGKNPMKDWRAAVRNWSRTDTRASTKPKNGFNNFSQRDTDMAELEKALLGKDAAASG